MASSPSSRWVFPFRVVQICLPRPINKLRGFPPKSDSSPWRAILLPKFELFIRERLYLHNVHTGNDFLVHGSIQVVAVRVPFPR